MLDKWPRRKSALWLPDGWGTEFLESVFTITSIDDCFRITDINRPWEPNELVGLKLIPVSGLYNETVFKIISNTKNQMVIDFDDADNIHVVEWKDPETLGGGQSVKATKPINLINKAYFKFSYILALNNWVATELKYQGLQDTLIQLVSSGLLKNASANYVIKYTNLDYPNPKTLMISRTGNSHVGLGSLRLNRYDSIIPEIIRVAEGYYGMYHFEAQSLVYYSGVCLTDRFAVGDKYRIYNPIKNDYVLDGNSVPVVSTAYWRAVSGTNDSITTNAVNWYWDRAGTVYLSYDPIYLGEITFDNEIQVEVTNGTDLRIRDYTLGDIQLEYEGYWVDRASVDITSLCRSCINSIVVSVRDNNAGKVGFVTPVWVKRNYE